jgi:hypothetical protein
MKESLLVTKGGEQVDEDRRQKALALSEDYGDALS